MKKNQEGFSALEALLILVIIGIVGFVGYYVYHSKNNADSIYNNAANTNLAASAKKPKAKTTTSTATSASAAFKVPELGIEILNIPTSLSDLNYAARADGSTQAFTIADFSTVSLTKLDPNCAPAIVGIGTLAKNDGTYDPNSGPEDNTNFVKQFSGFWISYSHPESDCSDTASTETLHVSQTTTFDTLVTNPANIETIK